MSVGGECSPDKDESGFCQPASDGGLTVRIASYQVGQAQSYYAQLIKNCAGANSQRAELVKAQAVLAKPLTQ